MRDAKSPVVCKGGHGNRGGESVRSPSFVNEPTSRDVKMSVLCKGGRGRRSCATRKCLLFVKEPAVRDAKFSVVCKGGRGLKARATPKKPVLCQGAPAAWRRQRRPGAGAAHLATRGILWA